MALKTLLVCLTDLESADAVMACAVPLARAHNAHLVGLHALEALIVYPGVAVHLPPEAYTAISKVRREEAEAIKAIFDRHTRAEDIAAEWRLLHAGTSMGADRIIECAQAADLIIMPNATTMEDQSDRTQARVIRESGRPVIIVPPGFKGESVGKRLVFGWSNTREATRAAHDLLGVAQPGSELTILRVANAAGDELEDVSLVELAKTYDRHGLRVQMAHCDVDKEGIAGTLLKHAFEEGADLIVTGAFGHSRAYDFVIGAVTYGLLRDAEIPVLFST